MDATIEKILRNNDDLTDAMIARCERADFGNLAAYLTAGYAAGLSHGGLWECEHCGVSVEDPAHPDAEQGCAILDDGSGLGNTILCHDCHGAATSALAKIVVSDDDEPDDDSALTDDEKTLAMYIEKSREGAARNARSMIAGYPREERKQLHHYQDQIDAENRRRGKSQQ